jgi:hypothetical protein
LLYLLEVPVVALLSGLNYAFSPEEGAPCLDSNLVAKLPKLPFEISVNATRAL